MVWKSVPRGTLVAAFCTYWIAVWATGAVNAQTVIDTWPAFYGQADPIAALPQFLQLPGLRLEEPQPPEVLGVPASSPLPESLVPPSNSPQSIDVPAETPSPAAETLPPPAASESLLLDSAQLFLPDVWQTWLFTPVWDGSFELGINATEGNSEALSFRTGGNIGRKTELWELKSNVIYAKSSAQGIETQHNAIFNTGYERFFQETAWSHFGKLNLEYDEFKAFDMRVAMNAGFGYKLVKTELTTVKGRLGTGVSHEINGPDERWVPEAVFGGDIQHQISPRQKLVLTTDYFPEWADFANYRLVTDTAWTLAMDDSSKLNLKLSVNNRYDSTPNGRKPNDVIYALLLLWQP